MVEDNTLKKLIKLYSFDFGAKMRTYQRWYAGTPYEYVESFVPRSGTVVDLGCGWGVFSNILALRSFDRKVYGLDLDQAKISWAKKTVGERKNIAFNAQDLAELCLPQVDAIVIYDVLHHLDETVQINVLKECSVKLASGGILIVKENDVVPYWKLIVSHLVEAIALGFNITLSKKILFRSREQWKDIFSQCGFTVTHDEHVKTPYGFFVPHSLFVCRKKGAQA